MTAWSGRWAGVGSGAGAVSDVTVAAAGTAPVSGANAATNVTLTGSANVVVTMPDDGSTLVRIIQGGSGGYTPTFKKPNGDAITWSPTDQPGWSAMAAGDVVEVRVWSVNGAYLAEWGYDIPALKARTTVLEAMDQSFYAGYWCTPPQFGGGSVSFTHGQVRFARWDFPETVTFDAWAWEVATTITLGASNTGTVRAGLATVSASTGKPGALLVEFDTDSISAAATLTSGARSFGPGGSGAGFTGANATEYTVTGGTSLYFFLAITGTSNTGNKMSDVSLQTGVVVNRIRSATLSDLTGGSTKYWLATGFTGTLGSPGASLTTASASGNMPRVFLRVKP